MIIDCHTHLEKDPENRFTPEKLLAAMDEAAVDYSIVLAVDVNEKVDMTTEEIVQLCEPYDRLKVVGTLSFTKDILQQFETFVDYWESGKIVGLKLMPGYQNFYPHTEELAPLYRYCEDNNIPVVFHTGILQANVPGRLRQAHPLTLDDLAHDFPQLKIVMAHVGNPWILDCAVVMAKNQNVYADVSGLFPEFAPITNREVQRFLNIMNELKEFTGDFKKCLFGTDWPLYNTKEYVHTVQQLEMSAEEKELVFWKNAATLFHLDIK